MNQIENQSLKKIARHVTILNTEVGVLKTDVRWIKKIMWYLAGAMSFGIGKVVFFGGAL